MKKNHSSSNNQKNHTVPRQSGSADKVPKLRFSEFKGDGEWEEKMVSDVANYENGKAHEQEIDESGNFIVVNSKFISTDGLVKKFTDTPFCLAYKDDILMVLSDVPNGRAIAKCFLVDKNNLYTVNQRICKIIPTKTNGHILFYILNRNLYFLAFDDGVKQTNLRNDDVLNCTILLPKSLPEQQKIAACLSSLDEYISAQSQKLEALKEHKKGLMQQLFPAEGSAVPELRFKEFRGSGEWEEKRLGEVGEFIGGGTPSKSKDSFWQGNIPWISSSDIDEDSIHQIKIDRFISEEALNNSATKMVPANSILLVSRVGVGKLAITKKAICTSQDFTNFTPNKVDLIFLAYYLKSANQTLLGFSQGMAIKGFTKDDISQLEIFIPSSKKEQQKIATCLSSLDDLISAQTEKIEVLKVHKKGLMQGLFP